MADAAKLCVSPFSSLVMFLNGSRDSSRLRRTQGLRASGEPRETRLDGGVERLLRCLVSIRSENAILANDNVQCCGACARVLKLRVAYVHNVFMNVEFFSAYTFWVLLSADFF